MKWLYNYIWIELNQSGEFIAKVDDVEIRKDTLGEAKAAIDAELKAKVKRKTVSLDVVGAKDESTWGEYTIFHDAIVGINRTTRELMFAGKTERVRFCLADTPENTSLVLHWIEQQAATKAIHDRIEATKIEVSGNYGRIPVEEYDGVLKKLVGRYEKSKGERK